MKYLSDIYVETQGACMSLGEPCATTLCRYHLHGDAKPSQVDAAPVPRVTCVLKIASCGPMTLEDVGRALGLTRERVRQIADKAVLHLHQNLQRRKIVGATRHE